jgi:hypothetical protein
MTKGEVMPKIEIELGHRHFVLEGDKALQVLDLLQSAEIYERRWRREDEGGTTHHIYPQDPVGSIIEISYLTDAQYNMYKLAGKPNE